MSPLSTKEANASALAPREAVNLQQLRAFVAVVDRGTLSRAAEALGISQSTVTFRIKGLEESVGARLLDRGGAEARPTRAGLLLLPFAHRILETAEEAIVRVRAEDDEPTGDVSIAASTVPAEYLLPPLLAAFRARYPAVSLTVRVSDSREAVRALLDGDCAIGFVGSDLGDHQRLVQEPFAEDAIVLVGPGKPGGAAPTALDETSLPLTPWVRREAGSGTRGAIDALLGEPLRSHHGQVEVGSTEAVRRCVLAGMGVAFVSRAAVQDDLGAGALRVVDYPGTPLRRHFHRLRLRSRTLSAAAEALWTFTAPPEAP